MSDSYFLRPDARGPALEILPGTDGRVLLTTSPGLHATHADLDPGKVEEVCRVMYRYAGLVWPGDDQRDDQPCTTKFREGECAGKLGHPGSCSIWGDGIPGDWWRGVAASVEQEPPVEPSDSLMPEIRSMVRRIETLEQGAADGAATDDMFVAQDKRISMLEERLHELRRAYTAHVDSPQHAGDVVSLLTEIRDRLPAPPPSACGADNSAHGGDLNCELPVNHEGRHKSGITSWPNTWLPVCGQSDSSGRYRCSLLAGHTGRHSADTGGPFNLFTWPQPQIPRQHPPTGM